MISVREFLTKVHYPVLFAAIFALLNTAFWILVFNVPAASRSLEWGALLGFGAMPVAFPVALLDGWLGIKLPMMGKPTPMGQNDYGWAAMGVLSWSGVGYLAGLGFSRLIGREDALPGWLLRLLQGMALSVIGIFWGLIGSQLPLIGIFFLFTWPLFEVAAGIWFVWALAILIKDGWRVLTSRFGRRPLR